jgi:hypothetical protein
MKGIRKLVKTSGSVGSNYGGANEALRKAEIAISSAYTAKPLELTRWSPCSPTQPKPGKR